MSEAFVPGQRVISDPEPELGLGTINSVEHRTVQVVFPASNEVRVYARAQAPLHRVRFSAGDQIKDHEGRELKITRVSDHQGLLTYHCEDEQGQAVHLEETHLNDLTRLNKPQDRLLSGQLDSENWYRLRFETLQQQQILYPSPVYGLCGPRVSLLPHQLYIAHEVARRNAPRVLLADEVGLGKTIEAGLILHTQLITRQAQRVLLVVPEALIHQWLVEMLRRFNLSFNLFDEVRCEALATDNTNPFVSEQLVLCSLDFFMQHPQRQHQAIEAGWDLLVVDEAHHLQWQPEAASDEYRFVEQLSQRTEGLLLLTATPEQLGAAGHFARLRLIDPDRFHDLDAFLHEEEAYKPVAEAASELLDSSHLSDTTIATLSQTLGQDARALIAIINDDSQDADSREQARDSLLHQLLDRHGTGRVLFRNTRSTVKGFPLREVFGYALEEPAEYRLIHEHLDSEDTRAAFSENFGLPFARLLLTPEVIYTTLKTLGARGISEKPEWFQCDPRIGWLAEKLRQLKKQKVLVICAEADTALDIEAELRNCYALRVSVFHEGLSIIERDRAAAWFADMEEGAQALICSEIGSEGRNFQFAHHLILFDLPLNPDLLEQRIGRLDRIGQRHTIEIHVPFLRETAQQAMFHWYRDGLQAFTRTCPAGTGVYKEVEPRLHETLEARPVSAELIDRLVEETRPVFDVINNRLQEGRDRLLELNSYRKEEAEHICQLISEQDRDRRLSNYTLRICDAYGVEVEDHSSHSYILRPGDHMQVHHFPELKEEAVTITFDRETALVHEDRWFMSWEHPMLAGIFDMLLGSERGNACLSVCQVPGLATGSLLLECLYSLEVIADRKLRASDFLPPTVLRILVDSHGKELSGRLDMDDLTGMPVKLGKHTINQIIQSQSEPLRKLLVLAEQHAQQQGSPLVEQATGRMKQRLTEELERLQALKKVNPGIRDEEIEFIAHRQQALEDALASAQLRLNALRLIIAA